MADYRLLAQYPKQQIVKDRNYGTLVAWAASEMAQDIPDEKPDPAWVRLRVVAEQIPLNTNVFVDQTTSYFAADPTIALNVREFMSPFNSEATEVALGAQNDAAVSAFMPAFAKNTVSDAQVQSWWNTNGFPDPPVEPPPMEGF